METFSKMLCRGLAQTASQITSIIQADLHHLGARIEAIEAKTDQTVAIANQNTDRIKELHEQLDIAFSKLYDLENRSRRFNFRLRGLPESFKETDKIVCTFIKNLIPDLPDHHLKMGRAHRALRPPCQDGLPRDTVVKLHFFRVKEEVMRRAQVTEKGHSIQIFADLSPYTIQKRRYLKPLLQILSQKSITYRWPFPFCLNFAFLNKSYSFSTFTDGEHLLLQLGLISHTPAPALDPRTLKELPVSKD